MTPERHHELSATLWDMDARAEVERVDVYARGRAAGSHQFQAYHAIPPDVAINMTEMNPYARVGVPTNRVAIWTTVRSRPTITFVKRFHRYPNIRDILCDCLWHVYAMLGKLHRRAYALSRA